MSGDLIPMRGRRNSGYHEADWIQLASAYEDWHDYLETGDVNLGMRAEIIFTNYQLWDHFRNEPMLGEYRQLIMTRC